MILYPVWGFRLDLTPLRYVSLGPGSSASNIAWNVIFWPLVYAGCLLIVALVLYYFMKLNGSRKTSRVQAVALAIILLITFTIAKNVSFKQSQFLNQASTNVVTNILFSTYRLGKYPEDYYDKQAAKLTMDSLYAKDSSTNHLLTTTRPNIIIVLLENFTADLMEPGLKDVAPNFNSLKKEGILFDNFFASGDRTEKGLAAVLSGYPSQTQTSLVLTTNKTRGLPFFSKDLKQNGGYYLSFLHGGDLNYCKMLPYLQQGSFDKIIHRPDFPKNEQTARWGVHDQYLFNRMIEEAAHQPQPFFSMAITLSSHEPFDIPEQSGDDQYRNLLVNSFHYTDKCIGDFISKAKTQPWWDNTLIILVADHGCNHSGNIAYNEPRKFRIPMLWLGGVVAAHDTTIHTISSQTDIAPTLLGQLNLNGNYPFGRNILSKTKRDFAFYAFNDGYGFVADSCVIVYDNLTRQYVTQKGRITQDLLNIPRAYLQTIYADYNSR